METRRIVLLVVVLLVANLVAATPSPAAEKTDVDILEVVCLLDPGVTWTSGKDGKNLHIRGYRSESVFYDPDTLDEVGLNTIIGNVNLDQTTGDGQYFGTFSSMYHPASAVDTFAGHWAGQISSGSYSGHAVGQGTGELKGQKIMVDNLGLSEADTMSVIGQLIALGRLYCPLEQINGVFQDVGFVLDPHG